MGKLKCANINLLLQKLFYISQISATPLVKKLNSILKLYIITVLTRTVAQVRVAYNFLLSFTLKKKFQYHLQTSRKKI